MTHSSSWLLRLAAVLALTTGACAKGATTLDEDANQNTPALGSSGNGGGAGSNGASPCGNGRIDDGEDCDGTMLGSVTCENLGFTGGQLSCDPQTCMYETSMCTRGNPGGGGNGG